MALTIAQIKAYIQARLTSDVPRDISGQDSREVAELLADELTYTTDLPDATRSNGLGGIVDGTTVAQLKGQKLAALFDQLLFPILNPTYTNPTATIVSPPSGGIVEIGSTVVPVLTAQYTKNDAGAPVDARFYKDNVLATTILVGAMSSVSQPNIPDQLGQPNPNNPNLRYSAVYNAPSFVAGESPVSTSYFARFRYAAGLAKNTNRGVADARTPAVRSSLAPQAAETGDTFQTGNALYTHIYPYFWGISDTQPSVASIQALLTGNDPSVNKVVAFANGNITIDFATTAANKFHWFAIPVGGGVPALDRVSWFFTANNQGDFLGGSGKLWSAKNTANLNSPTGLWTAKSYKIYFTQYLTSFEAPIQLRVS